MPVANSRFSRPRATSPSASERTLPCSRVRCAAISSRCCSTRFRIRNMISVRLLMLVARQPGTRPGPRRRLRRPPPPTRSRHASQPRRWPGCRPDRSATGARHRGAVDPVVDPLQRRPASPAAAGGSATCVMTLLGAGDGSPTILPPDRCVSAERPCRGLDRRAAEAYGHTHERFDALRAVRRRDRRRAGVDGGRSRGCPHSRPRRLRLPRRGEERGERGWEPQEGTAVLSRQGAGRGISAPRSTVSAVVWRQS